jgi:hypothetical protein
VAFGSLNLIVSCLSYRPKMCRASYTTTQATHSRSYCLLLHIDSHTAQLRGYTAQLRGYTATSYTATHATHSRRYWRCFTSTATQHSYTATQPPATQLPRLHTAAGTVYSFTSTATQHSYTATQPPATQLPMLHTAQPQLLHTYSHTAQLHGYTVTHSYTVHSPEIQSNTATPPSVMSEKEKENPFPQ